MLILTGEKRIGTDEERASLLLNERRKDGVNVLRSSSFQRMDLQSEQARGLSRISNDILSIRVI